jgi:geranylgeranyl pyrophosphate synthase
MQPKSQELLLTNFERYISETKQIIDHELSRFVENLSELKLYPLIRYAVLSRGKRLRPIMTVLSAQSVGGSREKALPLALAIELLHTATLIHDDIIDDDLIRRGVSTLHTKCGVNSAILVGDILISLAINLTTDFGAEILKITSKEGINICEGQYLDIFLPLNEATENDYLDKIRNKSASLFKAAALCGGIVGKGKTVEIDALAKFGENYGMAYQIRDDLKDVITHDGETAFQDLRNGRVTLPLIHLYKNSDNQTKVILIENFGKRKISRNVTDKLFAEMNRLGSHAYCERKILKFIEDAQKSLKPVRESMFKTYLKTMVSRI